ncbi:MAG: DUF433 domain-containing protein [Burkholderiales bacterium]|nr:DUF433 domain-containing protein [Burkholderiales bacterium]
MKYPPEVKVDSEIMGGAPCFAGTRVPIDIVLATLDEGWTIAQVQEHYDFITLAHVAAARAWKQLR